MLDRRCRLLRTPFSRHYVDSKFQIICTLLKSVAHELDCNIMAAERRISSIWHADLQSLGSVFRPATQFKAVSSESEISFLLPLVLVSFRSLALNIVCEIQWRTNLLDGVPGRLGRRSTGLRRTSLPLYSVSISIVHEAKLSLMFLQIERPCTMFKHAYKHA